MAERLGRKVDKSRLEIKSAAGISTLTLRVVFGAIDIFMVRESGEVRGTFDTDEMVALRNFLNEHVVDEDLEVIQVAKRTVIR